MVEPVADWPFGGAWPVCDLPGIKEAKAGRLHLAVLVLSLRELVRNFALLEPQSRPRHTTIRRIPLDFSRIDWAWSRILWQVLRRALRSPEAPLARRDG